MAKDARFKCFTLDGQTVVVEDYLEIRPERENNLKRHACKLRNMVFDNEIWNTTLTIY